MSTAVASPVDQLLKQAEDECEHRNYRAASRLFYRASQELPDVRELPPRALALYAMCIALSQRGQTSYALKLCRIAKRREALDATPWYAIARIYLVANSKRKAVAALKAGLAIDPTHRGLRSLAGQLGHRDKPPIGALPRSHPVNVTLGRIRHKLSKKR